jgi:methionyl-tRNA formyltransferase
MAKALAESATSAPGTLLRTGIEGVDVATGAGVLRLLELQRPGGRMLPAAEFLRGHPLKVGTVWPSRVMTPLVSPRPFPRAVVSASPR